MAERGPDGKFLPKDKDWTEGKVADVAAGEETQVAVVDVDERIAELESELASMAAEMEAMRPTKNVAAFSFKTADDVVALYGEDKIMAIVDSEIALENKKRVRDGYDRIRYSKEEKREKFDETVEALLLDRQLATPPREGWLARSLKMVKPDGSIIQIPYEGQVNNVAGSLADGYVRYEKKGFKRTDPMMCPTVDCYEDALARDGKWVFSGYCSEDHFKRTERGNAVPE
jgi:uncharacterized small protein (DUF1192 family)